MKMFKIVLVVALVALSVDAKLLSKTPQIDGRIVDGVDANIEEYSYQVSLHRNGAYICGGSIIGVKIILTAAHCTLFHSGISLSVRYGSSFVNQGGAIIDVSMLYEHVRHNPITHDYDISLLRLDRNMLLSPQAQIVNLVPSKTPEGGRSADVTGWGCIEESGPTSEKLQVLDVQEVDRDACNSLYSGGITQRMICFDDPAKRACLRHSGGPLVGRNGQIGIVSWGCKCTDAAYPGVYTNLDNEEIREEIESILKENGK